MKKFYLCLFNLFWVVFFVHADVCIEEYLVDMEQEYNHSGICFVDCVYVINLEKRPMKWQKTKDALNSFFIYPNRLNAINGWELTRQDITRLMGPYPHRLSKGQIGCILSHLSALRHASHQEYQCIWVCEDDIAIYENPHHLSQILFNLSLFDNDWDILYTDIDTKGPTGTRIPSLSSDFRPDQAHHPITYYLKKTKISEDISEIKQRFGAYSMFISKNGIKKILNYFNKRYLWAAYDIDIHYISNIKEYTLNRDLVSIDYTLPSDTEINYLTVKKD